MGSCSTNPRQDPSGFRTKEVLKDSHTSQLRMFLQRCAFGQGKEEHSGPICALCVPTEAPSKQGELSLLLDVETSSQSDNLTAKCHAVSLSGNLKQPNRTIVQVSHETCRIMQFTAPYCLKFLNFGKLSIPPTETFTQQRFPAKTPAK